jgi:hypothetical protein
VCIRYMYLKYNWFCFNMIDYKTFLCIAYIESIVILFDSDIYSVNKMSVSSGDRRGGLGRILLLGLRLIRSM